MIQIKRIFQFLDTMCLNRSLAYPSSEVMQETALYRAIAVFLT